MVRSNERHGHTRKGEWTGAYRSFVAAKDRCRNPNARNYRWYGARGIEFRFTSFAAFLAELGERPEGLTLDRKDVNGHYEPGNVRWIPLVDQQRNRRVRTIYDREKWKKVPRGQHGRWAKA